jgi:dCTP deaminase
MTVLLNDRDIRALSLGNVGNSPYPKMIQPFSEAVQGGSVISYGLSHAGYDLRLGNTLLVFKNSYNETIDPKKFNSDNYCKRVFDEVKAQTESTCGSEQIKNRYLPFYIPPHSYALGYSYEYLRIPKHIKGRCVGKSTLARCGILINTTPLEPGWEGHLTIEISNISPCAGMVYPMEGIAQLEFELLTGEPEIDYGDKAGKYQSQGATPVPAKVKE